MSNAAQLARFKTGTIADALDDCGLYDQALTPELRMLVRPHSKRIVGSAKVIGAHPAPRAEWNHKVPKERSVAFQKRLEAYIAPGDVVVWGVHGGSIMPCEIIGGFIAKLLQGRGAIGAIADGYIRDLDEITELGLCTIARGMHPAIMRGRVKGGTFGEPIAVGGVTVHEGDWIVADVDGTLVIPKEGGVVEKVLAFCERVAELEVKAWADVARGDAISDVFDRYGVL
jgi:regulator of RNase E activity RraA